AVGCDGATGCLRASCRYLSSALGSGGFLDFLSVGAATRIAARAKKAIRGGAKAPRRLKPAPQAAGVPGMGKSFEQGARVSSEENCMSDSLGEACFYDGGAFAGDAGLECLVAFGISQRDDFAAAAGSESARCQCQACRAAAHLDAHGVTAIHFVNTVQ